MEPTPSSQPVMPRVRLIINEAKDRYCFYCDDGGSLIDCFTCDRAFCYRIMGKEEGEDEEFRACISIPDEMVNDRHRRFRCPECLANTPSSLPDYIINRGSRSTRRITSRSSLALIIFHLDNLGTEAQCLLDVALSALCAFEVEVVSQLRRIGNPVDEKEAESIQNQLQFDGPYHLAVVFITEADPRGGWWISSEKSRSGLGRTNEKEFIRHHVKTLTNLANNATTSRMFVLSCGTNLFNPSTLGEIHKTVSSRPWHSLVLPTTPALILSEVVDILPELFVHLYYFGASFKDCLIRVWAKSVTTRQHTGFIIMDRQQFRDNSELSVSKIEYAAESIRPYGVQLPIPQILCGCWGQNALWGVSYVNAAKFGEAFYFLHSSCCKRELHVAIFKDRRIMRRIHGTTIIEEDWDESTKNFTFDPHRMVRMVQAPAKRGAEQALRPQHDAPWTLAGQQA